MMRALVYAAAFCTVSSIAVAETHVFIEARSQIVFNTSGEVEAVRHTWLFDEQYSAFATEGLSKDGEQASTETLAPLAKTNIESLKQFKYFTHLKIDGHDMSFLDPQKYTLEQEADKRIVLRFTLPLQTHLHAERVEMMTYDNTGFAEVNYPKDNGVELVHAPSICEMRLRVPQPDGSVDEFPPEAFAARIVVACSNKTTELLKREDQSIKEAAANVSNKEPVSKSIESSAKTRAAPGADTSSAPVNNLDEQHRATPSRCSDDATIETVKNLEGANSPVLKIYEKMGARIETTIEAVRTVATARSATLCEARLTIKMINLNKKEQDRRFKNDDLSGAVQKLEDASNQKVIEIAYKVEVTDEGQDYITLLPNGIDPAQQFQQKQ